MAGTMVLKGREWSIYEGGEDTCECLYNINVLQNMAFITLFQFYT